MLSVLNRYCHGFVAIPILEACAKRGLFGLLDSKGFYNRSELIKKLDANEGYFTLALQVLNTLGWIEKNNQDSYRLTEKANVDFPSINLTKLYEISPEILLQEEEWQLELNTRLTQVLNSIDRSEDSFTIFAEDALFFSLLLALKGAGMLDPEQPLKKLPKSLCQNIESLFLQKQWIHGSSEAWQFTDEAKEHINKIDTLHIAASYRSMLYKVEQILFGHAGDVLDTNKPKDSLYHRCVRGLFDGPQYGKFFEAIEALVLRVFNKTPYKNQPTVLAGMGGGSSLLKRLYNSILTQSERGSVLDKYPLTLLAIDHEQAGLVAAVTELQELPHQTLLVDIYDPVTIGNGLVDLGYKDKKQVLYVCTFLESDLLIDVSQDVDSSLKVMAQSEQDFYVNSQGDLISSLQVLTAWKAYFERFVEAVGDSDLILLDLHQLGEGYARRELQSGELFYLDTIHRLFHKYSIHAESFILLAARVGLFGKVPPKRYPATGNFCQVTLNQFEKRDYIIRHATIGDLTKLYKLEKQCWRKEIKSPNARIRARIENYPEGQFVLERKGQVVGVVYSQRIESIEKLDGAIASTVHEYHDPSGEVVQLLAVNIDPALQNLNLGDQLLEFMLQRCAVVDGVKTVVGVTLCKNYSVDKGYAFSDYIKLRDARGRIKDPILSFHESHGAKIEKAMAGYRPTDIVNEGFGVLAQYNIHYRTPRSLQKEIYHLAKPAVTTSIDSKNEYSKIGISQFIQKNIEEALEGNKENFGMDRPLMEIGLNSVGLLDLQEKISQHFNITLRSQFFFEFTTPRKVIGYLISALCADEEATVSAEEWNASDVFLTVAEHKEKKMQNMLMERRKEEITYFVQKSIELILGKGKDDFDFVQPLMEIGLDSADLLDLHVQISQEYTVSLKPAFFFEHSTPSKVVEYLCAILDDSTQDKSIEPQKQQPIDLSEERFSESHAQGNLGIQDIAIIGISCKLPGGIEAPEKLWDTLINGSSAIGQLPEGRFEWPEGIDPIGSHQGISLGGFVHNVASFDPAFFRISPKEAENMDPQQRILLELAWKCFENAGTLPEKLTPRDVGVFIGASGSDYVHLRNKAGVEVEAHHGTGGSLAVLANRISYFFDLSGPSLQIDTACSSSLVAVHSAMQSLQRGECSQALVGGINLICHPASSVAYYKAGMLASDGLCKTFDASANGYVRSEGAVMFLLKPLDEAVKNQDFIHALIKGSATNHGGLAGGLTVPNPQKQAELLESAWRNARLAPGELSYLEAHGTGTSLGDPIEVSGMQQAFASFSKHGIAPISSSPCGIASVKSNLGHLEAAAGIAGMLKTILCLQKKELPRTLHFSTLNPKIELDDSPLYIVAKNQPWEVAKNQQRIAGVSSFGSGGANAHVVLGEYCRPETTEIKHGNYLFVLSAKNIERLEDYARTILNWIGNTQTTPFANFIYTLQCARTAMQERLAIAVNGYADLQDKLNKWVLGAKNLENYWQKNANSARSEMEVLFSGGVRQNIIDIALSERNLGQLAILWSSGVDVSWESLYSSIPQRVPVPTYPFAKNNYWFESYNDAKSNVIDSKNNTLVIHPLLHENTSDLHEQRFTSRFTGTEFFLADHQIHGEKVFPGVGYLEMARAAVEKALGKRDANPAIMLKNIVWTQPLVINDGVKDVHIGVFGAEDHKLHFEIYSEAEQDGEPVIHAQGGAELQPKAEPAPLRIADIQAQMTRGTLTAAACYQAFNAMGFAYGDGHQGIQMLYQGDHQALARLSLPTSLVATRHDYLLHPSLMDAALQCTLGLTLSGDPAQDAQRKPDLPFALGALDIFAPCTATMYAWVRNTRHGAADKVQKFDIDLCDEHGRICVSLRAFSSRTLEGQIGAASPRAQTEGTLLATPLWAALPAEAPRHSPAYAGHHILLCELDALSSLGVEQLVAGSQCGSLQSTAASLAVRYEAYALACFERIKQVSAARAPGTVLIQVVLPNTPAHAVLAGVAGLLKTAALENPHMVGQVILVDPATTAAHLADTLTAHAGLGYGAVLRQESAQHQYLTWDMVPAVTQVPARPVFKEGGVYLITGGLGALGRLFAREILTQTSGARVILTGRSELSGAGQAQLAALTALGGNIAYRRVDIADPVQVTTLIGDITRQHRRLDGIIHSAGVIADNFIVKKSVEEFKRVLCPKVAGTLNLDRATRDMPLDFLVLFSSSTSVLGNLGQADYAAANGFMDSFAAYRNDLARLRQRQGHTLAINWPLWQDGGMHIDAASETLMTAATGMVPMRTETGIAAFYQGLSAAVAQLVVLEGRLVKMRQRLLGAVPSDAPGQEPAVAAVAQDAATDSGDVLSAVQKMLMGRVSDNLKVPLDDIDLDTELNDYGFDSISLTAFTNQLNHHYDLDLNPTVFFEYSTLGRLSDYLVQAHHAVFAGVFTPARSAPASLGPAITPPVAPTAPAVTRRPRFATGATAWPGAREAEPVAIVGMSGCFPGAQNLEQFWANLVAEKDSITEIPRDRWDWQALYGDPHTEFNKSNVKWGGFIDSVAAFDPRFFGISPREAELMDPQQRLLMTHIYLALEDANCSAGSLSGSNTGIFVGTGLGGYSGLLTRSGTAIEGYTSTGAVYSVGPNRMSFFLNLHGPSEAIETACSSSLVAIHRAVQAMQTGSCEAALVGGVNTLITPDLHISFNKAGMLSEGGRCKTFSAAADGYVRGEGVGILFLKTLRQAEADKDRIYGVIRGSAENHGGRANSLTAPNPKAQAALLKSAYTQAGFHPNTISYIEAHGTGTALGDPIEINGLKAAFDELYQERGATVGRAHCGLGSVKSNIGHLELAAGVAGVIKVLLQFKHQQLVKTLHCEEVNPYIQLQNTPFYLVQEAKPWVRLKDASGQDIPRRAGVSSFGFGGANAHIVLEEYDAARVTAVPTALTSDSPVIIPLSARTPGQLTQKAEDLLAYLRSAPVLNLSALAYTLQVGREAMETRLGLLVTSVQELEERLAGYLAGEAAEGVYSGQVKANKESLALFTADEELQEAIEKWVARKKVSKLLELWVKGLTFDWNKLYGAVKPTRISVPTYPFAQERYWVAGDKAEEGASHGGVTQVIHPLLHENTSDLHEQRFTSRFTGTEFFLADHQIHGQKTLPAVAYLEMARRAVAYVLPEQHASATLELIDVAWGELMISQDRQLSIALFTNEDKQLGYEVFSSEAGQERIHCQGKAKYITKQVEAALNIQQLKSQMRVSNLDINKIHSAFEKIGIHYGASFKSGMTIYQGEQQVLAQLSLPEVLLNTSDDYLLHPIMMDAALKASIGLVADSSDLTRSVAIPSTMDALSIISACTQKMYAWIRYSIEGKAKVDIDLTDMEGNICVRMRGVRMNTVSQASFDKSNATSGNESKVFKSIDKTPVEQAGSCSVRNTSASAPLVVIGGAGLFGICMGVFLKRANIPFKIIEKNADVGGVWFVNRWPGCGCDIPMLAYAYSFEHFKGDMWAKQSDILEYLQSVAKKYGLYEHIEFNTRILAASYDDTQGQWGLALDSGETINAKYFINGANEGLGHRKKMPSIPGMEEFNGMLQHVLECNADEIDFKNKKVAIIGNGTTQVQLVETLQPVVDRLTVYARTPKYLYPRAVYTEQTQQRLSDDYEFWLQSREEYLSGVDKFFHVLNDPIKINPFHPETQVKKYFNRVIDDEWLYFYKWLEKRDMVPDYTPGCSRPCLSHSYHKQIRADNVLLEGSRITRIIPTGIETENGVQDFDIIICATGYDLHEFKPFFPITGRDSADLNNHFEGFPKTYAGSAVSSFPNLFFGAGPGSGTNSTSVTEIYESNCANLLDIINYCESNNIKSIEVKHEEVERFVNFVRAKNQEGSFGSGCSSWYQTEKGENAAIFPGTLGEFREWQKFDPKRYNFEYYTGDSVVELPKSVTSSITVSTSTIEANTKAEAAPVAMTDIQTLVSDILSLFSMITKIDTCKLDTNEPLGSYGIDSIMIAELARKISGRFSITLDAVNLFELSSLAELISLVERKVKESNANQPVQHSVPVMPASSAESQVTFLYNRLTSQRPASRTMHIAKNNVTQPPDTQLDIAIIGMSGVFPESIDLEQYWENINDGKDCIREIPKERWLWEESYGDPSKGNYTKVKWGGFINDVDLFDPGFFHISPLEARLMDPQHRLYLQNVYHAIENAGYNPQALKGKRISVYYSANTTDYQKIVKEGVSQTPPVTMQAQAHVFAPSRVSYMLGLTGPCELIDTACSSSGVSINHAINSIIHDGCEGALVGATNLMLLPDYHSMYDKVGMICEDGRCKTFSADANGYARGEGVGVIFLKPLSQAEKDGDPIIGVIRAISVNHGGKSNSLTTPNVRAQFDLINSVIKKANIDPRQVGLIECHGTGTSLGDPIEVTALKDAYAAAYKEHGISSEFDRKRIGLGSIKSNIGHTEPLAGLAGLIKVLLSLKNKVLPKTLHVNKVNPLLKLEETPFYILDEKKTWERPEIAGRVLPRMAALSTFGIGNTNVHMIIEEYCGRNISPENDGVVANSLKLIPLSANNQEQLKERVRDLFDFICKSESVELASIAYTLQVGREAMEERLGIIVSSMAQLREKLQAYLEGQQGIEWLYQGQVKSNRDTLTAIAADDEELLSTIDNWNSPKNASKLLELWVKGFQFDWGKLYGNARPNRVNLPTYPFAKKRYWISDTLRNDMTSESKDNISVTSKENLRTLSQSTLSLEINNTMSKPRNIELPVLSEMPYESESRPVINNETKSVSATETNVSLSNTQSISNIQRDTSRDNLRTQFANSLAKALYMDVAEITFNKAFIDMGLDSIVAIEWVKAINEEFGVTISATKLYDYPTIVELAEFVAQKIQDKAVASTLDKGNEKNNLEQVAKPVTLKTDVGSSKFEYSETLSFVLQKELRHSLAKALYMDESDISYEKSFIDLGLDSIVATEWIKSINEKYGLSISATRIYDFPTITQFSAFLASKMKRFADYAGNEVEQPVISEMPLNGAQADTSLSQHAETKIYMDALDESTSSSLITRKTLHEELRIGLAKALYMDESDINGDKAFTDLGLDSIVAIEWVKSINEGYGLTLSATKLYDYPTIAKLAGFLEEEVAKSSPTSASLPAVEHQEMLSAPSTPAEQSVFTEPVYRQSDSAKVTGVEKVAIIGMSGKYPGAENLGEYWDNLAQGKNSIREIPISRWDVNQYFDPDPSVKGKVYSKWLGMLDDIDCFDPLFFKISPVEAELMDPQQRLFLQESYKAFEDAGYAADTLSNMKCGVYLGIMSSEYSFLFSKNNLNISATGTSYAIAAARISYHLNLKGPAIPIDTACSSSLVSIHLACQALINHEVDMALAGGVTLYLTPDGYISMCQSGMLSPEGLCKAFDDSADGFVPGEGVGAVVLKRLSDAEKDGDFIHGVILGSGINQDGKTNGITAPSANSQKELLSEIYSKYKINPETVNYIEAHGTGTKLGDPIELDALSEVFSKKDTNKNYCALASVKSNIGHTSGAAGVASLQKVLLSMKHRKLAPSLHFKKGNAHFDFNNSPFYVNSELKHWESHPNSLRRAGVSAFGFSGTNAHLVLEEYPYNHASRNVVSIQSKNTYIIPISAKNKSRLYEYVQRLKEYISGSQSISLMELAYTLQTGRTEMDVRVAFAVKDLSQLLAKFDLFLLNEEVIENVFQGQVQKNDEVLKLFSNIAYITDDWVKRGELSNIMDLWVRGFQFDWHKLYGEVKPMRISLPTYPFAKERYWLPEIKDEEQVEVAHSNSRHPVLHPLLHENISDLSEKRRHTFVKKGWRVAPVLTQQAMISPIIVLHNEATKTLAEAIKRKVAPTLLVQDNNVDYDEFKHKVASCKVWIDLTGIEQDTSRTAWVSLLQAVIEENRANKVQLFYITQGVESLFNGSITLSGAQRVGLYRMLQSEYSGITSRHVDLEPKASTLEQHVELILQEVSSQSHDIESCYRNGERYVSYLHETKHESSQSIDFNDSDVVLVTGGTRGVGLLCASHLVTKHGVKRLVLTGREVLPPQETWGNCAQFPQPIQEKIKRIQQLQNLGAEVKVCAFPLDDLVELTKQYDAIQASMGRITGIIHSAGLLDSENPAFIRKTPESIAEIMSPKVKGLQHLMRLVDFTKLKFALLFSSVSAAIPSLGGGQSDYVMANAFMDYVANARGTAPLVSIQWPSWKETGMGEVVSSAYKSTGLLSITDEEGCKLLDLVLENLNVPVMMPLVVDVDRFNCADLMQTEELKALQHVEVFKTNETETHTEASANLLQQWLQSLFESELKLQSGQLDVQTSFADYGVDSILLTQILQRLKRELDLKLAPSILLEYSTLAALSAWLQENHPDVIAAKLSVVTHSRQTVEIPIKQTALPMVKSEQKKVSKSRDNASRRPSTERIAVVGMSCRFPGASNIEEYWQLLSKGKSAITAVPKARWGIDKEYYAGLIDETYEFDHEFFMLPPEDVAAMDPQALVLLEESLNVIYHAGYTHHELAGMNVGVYIGARGQQVNLSKIEHCRNPIMAVGQNYLAANISQFFNLRGPSLVIDTACSSSLVGMNMAVEAMCAGTIDSALVGGVSLLANSSAHEIFAQRNLLQANGEFHILDQRASGVVLGEGCGMVYLKPLEKAKQDGDCIYAVIEGIGVNNDGRTAGPATPNMAAQADVMQSVLKQSQCASHDISYLDVNGSGSEVTDLLEIKAVASVYASKERKPLYLGSMKPNIGHPLCAEGIASFIKVALMLQHQQLVPFLSGQEPLAHYSIERSGFAFPRQAQAFEMEYAALNCFADGGTNAHVILSKSYQN